MCSPPVKPMDSGQRCPYKQEVFTLSLYQFNRKTKPSSKPFYGICGGPRPLWPQLAFGAIAIQLQVGVSLCHNDGGQFILSRAAHRLKVSCSLSCVSTFLNPAKVFQSPRSKTHYLRLSEESPAIFALSSDQLGDISVLLSLGSLYASLAISLSGFSKTSVSSLTSLPAISLQKG